MEKKEAIGKGGGIITVYRPKSQREILALMDQLNNMTATCAFSSGRFRTKKDAH